MLCAVLNRAKDYAFNFLTARFLAWRFLLFVSGFCSAAESRFHNRGPISIQIGKHVSDQVQRWEDRLLRSLHELLSNAV